MPTPSPAVPAALAAGPFTTRRAAECGIGRGALRHPRFRQLLVGVHVLADLPSTPELHARAALLAVPEGAALCRSTAAELRGWPSPSRTAAGVHVAVADPSRVPHVRGVVAHEGLRPGDAELVDLADGGPAVLMTAPAATWRDLGAEWRLDDLVALADALLWRGAPLCDRQALESAALDHAGRRGVVRLREALGLARDGSQSPRETQVRLALLRAGLPEPDCNEPVHGADGGWLARPDMQWPRWRVLLEYDGAHHRDADQHARDEDRRWRLERAGWLVVVVTDRLWRAPWQVVARVDQALRSRGYRPGAPALPA